jgi:hypothetical protein
MVYRAADACGHTGGLEARALRHRWLNVDAWIESSRLHSDGTPNPRTGTSMLR